jgi:hypothetical protein
MTAAKRGRRGAPPIKPAKKGERYQIGVIVAGTTKKLIVEQAKISGRSISREAEHLIERAVAYDKIMKAMSNTLEELRQGSVEAVLFRLGYVPIRDAATGKKAWAEPGYPGIERSGFESWKPGELEAALERTAIIRQAAGITDEDIERTNREKLRQDERQATGAPAPKDDAA